MVIGCGGYCLNFLASHASFAFTPPSLGNKWALITPPINWYPESVFAPESVRMAFQTFVLPMLSCKWLTLELAYPVNNHRWHLEEGEIAPHDFHICITLSQVSTQTPPHLTQKQTQKPLWTHTSAVYLKIVRHATPLIHYLARCTL